MKISDKSWAKYIEKLRKVNDTAADKMLTFLDLHRDEDGLWNSPETRQLVLEYAYGLSVKYGEAAAELACEMYDMTAEVSNVSIPAAEPAATATYGEVAKAVNGTMKTANERIIAQSVSRLVKMVSVDTVMQNALRDGAEWAWIPRGDTCAFCITLASRGWQKASRKALKNGHAEHIHANCDCTYGVRFDKDTEVEGYDPDKYLEMYETADGATPADRINAMRRRHYARNEDKINAQKRAAYAERKHGRGLSSRDRHGYDVPDHEPPEFLYKLVDGDDRDELLLKYEQDIIDEPIENAIVITKEGEVYRCRGTLNGVYPDTDLGDKLYGADVTHNHPIGSDNEYTFSDSDRYLFEKYRLNTMRGVDELFVYVMDRNAHDIDEQLLAWEIDDYSFRHSKMIQYAERDGFGYRRRRHADK